MAARENQGYLISIILMLLLIVILAILTYFAFMQAGAASSNLDEKDQLLATANARLTAFEEQAAILKAYVGIAPFTVGEVDQRLKKIQSTSLNEQITETNAIKEQFEADMNRYIRPTADGVEKTYRGLVDDMGIALMATHRERQALNATVQVAEEDKQEAIARKDAEIAAVREQLDGARSDLTNERDLHTKTKNTLNTQLQSAKESNRQISEQHEQARTAWNSLEQTLRADRQKAETRAAALEDKLAKYETKRYDIPDGSVVRVSPEIDRVYVNLGSADQLQLRQSFAIYDQSIDTFERGQEKAKIEITNITGPHTAEARIIESSNVNPILRGDYVMTSTWDRGYSVPVALAGFFDLDGDNKSDLERVMSLLEQNGANIVAYHDENGQVRGKVNEDTRYLIMGSEPTSTAQIQAMSRIQQDAKDFVVQRVPLREYLNSVGLRVEGKVMQGTGTLGRGNRFPNRQPPARDGSSAFGGNNN